MLSKLNKAKLLSVLQSDRKIHFGVAYTPKITRLDIVNVNNTFFETHNTYFRSQVEFKES